MSAGAAASRSAPSHWRRPFRRARALSASSAWVSSLASLLTWVWTWIAESPASVTHTVHPIPATEGDRIRIAVEVQRSSRFLLGSMAVTATIGRIGQRACRLRVRGRTAHGEIDLGRMPRGVFPVTGTEVTLGDLLGLVSLSPAVSCQPARVVVRPKLVELDGLFSEAGTVRRRWAAALAAALGRLRLPLRSRVRAGRVASARALADECTQRHPDGQGARGQGI